MTKIASSSVAAEMRGKSKGNFSQLIYLKQELLLTSSRALMLMEVSFQCSSTLSYKAWLINSMDKMDHRMHSRKPYASADSIERQAAVIEAIAQDFLGQLNLQQESFHFAMHLVTRMARGLRLEKYNLTVFPLMKSAIERQTNLLSPEFSLQRKFMSLSTFLKGHLLDGCTKENLVEHLLSNEKLYNLKCCGFGDDVCFAGEMKVSGFSVNYFIGWHESMELALDVFVLFASEGQHINAYITQEGSNCAERVVDVVLISAMTMVQEVITNASKNIRKFYLWKTFGENYTPAMSSILVNCITELRAVSHPLDLVSVDSRLEKLLCDELYELQLPWQEIFNIITRSPSFLHCITGDNAASNYLVYCEDYIFLDFELNYHGRVKEARILTREKFKYDECSNTRICITVRHIVQRFTMFLLQWMWSNCEISF